MAPGLYRVIASGFRPDGSAVKKKRNVRKPKLRRKKR
jgi:hypothetical protein